MQNLTLNELGSDKSVISSKGHHPGKKQLKKRRFREIDNAWDLSLEEGAQSILAVQQRRKQQLSEQSDESMSISSSRKGQNRR